MKTTLWPVVVLVGMVASSARSQEVARPLLASVSGGLGVATAAIGGQASLTVSHELGDLILRTAEASDFEIFMTPETTSDIGLLYGHRRRWGRGWARAAAGVAHVRRAERGEVEECQWFACRYELVTSNAVGMATQFDLVWAPVEVFGLGVTAVGNLNGVRSFGVLTVSAHLGLVR